MDIYSAMDMESHHMQSHDFPQPTWVAYSPPQHPHPVGPIPTYHGFGYGPSPIMRMEPSYSMSIPPPYAPAPLALPSQPWPSMLATQPQFMGPPMPAVTMSASVSAPAPIPSSRKSSTSGSTPRRTLTDEDRRRMCLYHEENKSAKQTDIGAIFGVERSTVSKVLRQKEKYLKPKGENQSPIKKPKGKVPDVEKALYNWIIKRQQQGALLTDEQAREKALRFARTCGSPAEEKVLSASWLEKFKQKYNLTGIKSRKNSLDIKGQAASTTARLHINAHVDSTVHTPNNMASPTSPSEFATPSPLSPTQIQEGLQKELANGLPSDIACDNNQQPAPSNPSNSLDASSSLSSGVTSPSTLVSDSPFTPTSQSNIPFMGNDSFRPRSQTFTFNAVDPSLISSTDEPLDQFPTKPSYQRSMSVAGLQPPFEETDRRKITLNTTGIFKRNYSDPDMMNTQLSMDTHPFPQSNPISPVSSPGSPTQDEARRALELLMNYFQHQPSGLGTQDYVTIGKLMERLEIAKNHPHILPGGLTRIDEQDNAPRRVSKKRSIHTLS